MRMAHAKCVRRRTVCGKVWHNFGLEKKHHGRKENNEKRKKNETEKLMKI